MSLFFSKNGSSVPPHSIVFFFLSNRCAIYKWLHRVAFAQHADISIRFVSPGNIDLYLDNNSHLSLESCEFRSSLFLFVLFFCFLFCVPISHRYEIGFSKCGGVWKFRNPLNLGRVRASPNIDGIFLRSSKLRKRERLVLFRHRTDATNKGGGGHQICRLPQT